MVLAYWGHRVSESRVGRLLRSQPFGTPARNVRFLESWGFSVTYGPTSLGRLRSLLRDGTPCIVFVQAGQLSYWTEDAYHAVVVVGLTADEIYLHDPAFDQAPQVASLGDFMLAWSDFDYLHAMIVPR